MTRRSPRALTRRLALALSLMLVVSVLALPAVAEDGPKTFTADITAKLAPDEHEESLSYSIEIVLENTSEGGSGLTIGSANVTPPEEVTFGESADGEVNNRGILQLRDLNLAPGDHRTISVTATAEACDDDDGEDFGVVAKQSNQFRGSGNDLVLTGDGHLGVEFPCPETTEEDEEPLCEVGVDGDCTNLEFDPDNIPDKDRSQQVTIDAPDTDGAKIFGGYRTSTELADVVSGACEEELGPNDRLALDVIEIDPRGFKAGDELTVTYLIPRAYVNEETNRGAGNFQVCFAPDKPATGWLSDLGELQNTDLYGPVLLPPCSDEQGAPCIESRTKQQANVVITFRIPAEDPWLK